jgi:hypothetical protein
MPWTEVPAGRENRRFGLVISLTVGIAIACLALSIAYVSLWRGDHDGLNHAVGRDFINLWTASQLIEADRAVDIFDQQKFAAAQRRHMGPEFPFHFWSYPPHTLLLSQQLSNLPYRAAFVVWSLAGLIVMLYAAYMFWPSRLFPWLLLLAPSSFVNVFLGQNGFVTAALALGGFAMLPRRPIVAGIMFGLLTFKPHLGIMIPIALLALRQWPAIAAAIVTAALFMGASALMYGADVWWQFFQSTLPYQMRFMATGEGPFQWMMPSWFMAGRIIGLPLWLSQTAQAAAALAAGVLVYRVFRRPGNWRMQVSLLFVATLVASPQGFNYDMGLVSVALICLVWAASENGWRRGELAIITACWVLPLIVMPLNAAGVPVAPLLLAGLLACLYRYVGLEPGRHRG